MSKYVQAGVPCVEEKHDRRWTLELVPHQVERFNSITLSFRQSGRICGAIGATRSKSDPCRGGQ